MYQENLERIRKEDELRQKRLVQSRAYSTLYGFKTPKRSCIKDACDISDSGEPSAEEQKVPPLSAEQQRLVDIAKSGACCFFSGSAGTGKSFTLHTIVQELRRMGKRVSVVAPTGIAAMHVGGKTIHSFAGISPTATLEQVIAEATVSRKTTQFESLDVLVIDEISMVSAVLFEMIEVKARMARRRDRSFNENKTFGGLQIIVSGDFFQLPPVPSNPRCPECASERVMIPNSFVPSKAICLDADCKASFDPRTLYAFQSPKWEETKFHFVELTQVFRQDDKEFVALLNRIRKGIYIEEDRNVLNSCMRPLNEDLIWATRLYSHKKTSKECNEKYFNDLTSKVVYTFNCHDLAADNKRSQHLLPEMCKFVQAEKCLKLKKGTQVMLIANISPESRLVNGSRGVVIDFDYPLDNRGRPDQHRGKCPVVVFENDIVLTVGYHDFEVKFSNQVSICRKQIPLLFGWAITIHKSQGMSLDKASLDLRQAFSAGQAYVALSRVRSLKGLELQGDPHQDALPASRVIVDPIVIDFYEKCQQDSIPENEWQAAVLPSIREHFKQVGVHMMDPAEEFAQEMKKFPPSG